MISMYVRVWKTLVAKQRIKMFVFIKKWFYIGSLFSSSLVSVSMKNQEHKVKPETINVDSNEPVFYPFSIETSKCSRSCNNINDPYA